MRMFSDLFCFDIMFYALINYHCAFSHTPKITSLKLLFPENIYNVLYFLSATDLTMFLSSVHQYTNKLISAYLVRDSLK